MKNDKRLPKTGKIGLFTDPHILPSEIDEIVGEVSVLESVDSNSSGEYNHEILDKNYQIPNLSTEESFPYRIPTVQETCCQIRDEEDERFGDPVTRFDYLTEMYGAGIARLY